MGVSGGGGSKGDFGGRVGEDLLQKGEHHVRLENGGEKGDKGEQIVLDDRGRIPKCGMGRRLSHQ